MSKKVKKAYGKKQKKNKTKKIKGTLDKKIKKALKKDLDKVFEVKSLEKAKADCNHRNKKGAVDTMTVAQLKAEQLDFLVPNLQAYIDLFGEENVEICKGCYTPVVSNIELVDAAEVARGAVMMEAMSTAIVINSEKSKEVEAYRSVIKENQKTTRFIMKKFRKISGAKQQSAEAATKNSVNKSREM
jgi:hypothetical protein